MSQVLSISPLFFIQSGIHNGLYSPKSEKPVVAVLRFPIRQQEEEIATIANNVIQVSSRSYKLVSTSPWLEATTENSLKISSIIVKIV